MQLLIEIGLDQPRARTSGTRPHPARTLGNARVWPGDGLAQLSNPAVPLVVIGELYDAAGRRQRGLAADEARAILASDGRRLIEAYWGRYVALWHDASARRTAVLRDPSGAIPLFVRHDEDQLILVSDLHLLPWPSKHSIGIDSEGLAHRLWFPGLPARRTAIASVREILPGELLEIGGGAVRRSQLWSPWRFAASPVEPQASDLACVVQRTVGALAARETPVMLELSGGLDSSIVAACLAKARAPWQAATIVTPAADGDERSYARMVAQAFDVPLQELALAADDVDLLAQPKAPQASPGGYGMLAGLDRALVAAADRRGCAMLVSGTGGDNVFCSLRSAAPVLDAWRLSRLAAMSALGDIGRLTHTPLTHVFVSALRYAWRDFLRPHRWRVDSSLLAAGTQPELALHPWLERPRDGRAGTRAHIAAILRAHHVTAALSRAQSGRLLLPLLAQPVVEACLAISSPHWVRQGIDRAVARDAFRAQLPPAIVARRSKGRLGSLLAPAYDRDRQRLGTLLCDGMLAGYGLLDRDAIVQVTRKQADSDGRTYTRILELADAELWARAVTRRS